MVDAGIDQKTAMAIGGWRTDSIFRRYTIASQKRLDDAAAKMSDFQNRKAELANAEKIHSSYIDAPKEVQNENDEPHNLV